MGRFPFPLGSGKCPIVSNEDIAYLRDASELSGYIIASGYIYDVQHGNVREVITPTTLRTWSNQGITMSIPITRIGNLVYGIGNC